MLLSCSKRYVRVFSSTKEESNGKARYGFVAAAPGVGGDGCGGVLVVGVVCCRTDLSFPTNWKLVAIVVVPVCPLRCSFLSWCFAMFAATILKGY
jgi:hypothetical protein